MAMTDCGLILYTEPDVIEEAYKIAHKYERLIARYGFKGMHIVAPEFVEWHADPGDYETYEDVPINALMSRGVAASAGRTLTSP
jgi:hypothetical protein